MAQKDLTKMNVLDLEEYIQAMGLQVDGLRAEQERAHVIIDELNAETAAAERIKNLSDVERTALEQALQAKGVPTESAVGELSGE